MLLSNSAVASELQWKKIPVLDDGFVCLVDVMGDDAAVAQAARVSYGKDCRDERERLLETLQKLFPDGGSSPYVDQAGIANWGFDQIQKAGEKIREDERTLLRYMMRSEHGSPFEMCEVKMLVRVPMDCWRQWIRHRTANVNEYSTRYSPAIDSQQKTASDQWRLQSGNNKQGSDGFLPAESDIDPEDQPDFRDGSDLTREELDLQRHAAWVYETRINAGVAREQARKDLPLSTYTEAYWKCDLRNIFGFLKLRMDSHAQLEIRNFANAIGEQIIKPLFPRCWEAFEDYQLHAMKFSRLELQLLATMVNFDEVKMGLSPIADRLSKREREEFITKIKKILHAE